jgi:protocatechuate 3,4-dioxygenase, beta subunit
MKRPSFEFQTENLWQASLFSRRQALQRVALGSALLAGGISRADDLILTPAQTEGPFYPDRLPLDTDNDLLRINEDSDTSLGQITWVSGVLRDNTGKPVRNATIEIWQCDSTGVYLHSRSGGNQKGRDSHFQGFGRFLTGQSGEYMFRTIKPVPYPGRTPHIHFAVKLSGKKRLVTQCYIKDEPLNDRDGVLRRIQDERQRESVIVPFNPLAESKSNELAARFDITLGFTPEMI